MLRKWNVSAELKVGSMTDLPYGDGFFDVILDVFSSYCLSEIDFSRFMSEARRVLKQGGKFFSYFPSKKSDAFLNHAPARLLDSSTLDGIYRDGSPFSGNHYPFRFIHPEEYRRTLRDNGFSVDYLETVTRSYGSMSELFQHVVVEGTAT
jgi:SAM-dependent methyltransferase